MVVWFDDPANFSILPQLPQKNISQFKHGQKRLKNNHLALLVKNSVTLCNMLKLIFEMK